MLPSSSRGDARRLNEHVTRDLSLRRPRPRASESIKGELSRARFILKYPPSAGYSQRRNCTHTYSLYASAPSGNSFSSAPARTNHKRRLAVIALVLLGSVGIWFLLRGRAVATNATPEIERSVVVLPFDNASRDTAQEYFANGLTDELTGRLAQVGLRVTGRNTAYAFKGKHPTPQEAGRVADVATVLTGTVRRLGDRVRVSAELARASDNAVLWTFASERAVPEIVALQRDMVDSIATRLAVTSRVAQRAEASVDPRAYDLVLRARFAANQVTREGIARSLVLFDSALVLQPRLVNALIGKEIALGYLADGYESPRKVVPTMDSLLRVAMSTDSTRPDVLGNAALLNAGWVTNWALARRFAADARRREPYNVSAMFATYVAYVAYADLPCAKALLDTLRVADPANPLGSRNRFLTSDFTNDSTGARTAWDLVPESVRHADYGDVIAAYLPLVRGDYAEAIRLESVVIVVAWRRWNLPS